MEIAIGIGLALVVGVSMTLIGMDRDRALYPAIMIVIAALYILFAVMGGSTDAILVEALIATVFVALAVAGFKRSLWLVVIALAMHGVYDIFHPRLVTNPGVPSFWPAFCSAYDIVAAVYLAVIMSRTVNRDK